MEALVVYLIQLHLLPHINSHNMPSFSSKQQKRERNTPYHRTSKPGTVRDQDQEQRLVEATLDMAQGFQRGIIRAETWLSQQRLALLALQSQSLIALVNVYAANEVPTTENLCLSTEHLELWERMERQVQHVAGLLQRLRKNQEAFETGSTTWKRINPLEWVNDTVDGKESTPLETSD